MSTPTQGDTMPGSPLGDDGAVKDLDWKFCQVFGEPSKRPPEEVTDVDIVSVVEFDHTGEFLAAGDRGGRVVVFERLRSEDTPCEYKFYAEFQSHEPEFDYLKSLEIEEKINKIKWVRTRTPNSMMMLTTNDKTIKLWKVQEHMAAVSSAAQHVARPEAVDELVFPSPPRKQLTRSAICKRSFANAHTYHINSIALNSDMETFISADDLRINLWNTEISDQSFNIVDIKPPNMEDLAEVITAAEFHPRHCNLFMYSSSKGTVRLVDMRSSALCDSASRIFEDEEDASSKSFFSEIISSVSDVKFTPDGRYIVSRDYLTLRVWDIRQEYEPVMTVQVHDYLRPRLCDLYENDYIFDKFEVAVSGDGNHMVTGSYNNFFNIYDLQGSHADPAAGPRSLTRMKLGRTKPVDQDAGSDNLDYTKKAMHVAWHPSEDIIAIGASNNLYLYAGEQDSLGREGKAIHFDADDDDGPSDDQSGDDLDGQLYY